MRKTVAIVYIDAKRSEWFNVTALNSLNMVLTL